MSLPIKSIIISLSLISINCNPVDKIQTVTSGAEVLISKNLHLIENKNLGIVTNHTAILSNGIHLIDTLNSLENINIRKIFSPEHGYRGNLSAGTTVIEKKDSLTGIPVYSLYGKTKKPTKKMLAGIDLLIFDIQDIGSRFYTYISTLFYVIEAASENDIPIIVLDRPNPVGGINSEGPLLKDEYKSFVGIANIPIRHAMTIGELALYFNDIIKNNLDKKANLTVIKMEGWQREFYFDQTNMPWVKPSPNITDLQTAIAYPGMCLLEGTNISEGRGTGLPFLIFGAPFVKSDELLNELSNADIGKIEFEPAEFTPISIQDAALRPKYENEECYGLKINITDIYSFNSVNFVVTLLSTLHKLYPKNFRFNEDWIKKLFGDDYLVEMIAASKSPAEIISRWQEELAKFRLDRKAYLLY